MYLNENHDEELLAAKAAQEIPGRHPSLRLNLAFYEPNESPTEQRAYRITH